MVATQADYSTIDLSMSRVKLRSDLVFVPQTHGNQIYCHIEVPATSGFYRIGYAEYVFISLLDGETTFAEALTITAQQLGATTLDNGQALDVITWLMENDLATIISERSTSAPRPRHAPRKGMLQDLNPLGMKLRLCEPDRFIAALVPSFGWLYSTIPTAVAVGLMAISALMLLAHSDRFVQASDMIFSPINWVWMLGCWLVLKVIHEFSHGLACKRYGGEVREMGVMFVLFAPLAYVDVTSSWRFSSKWQRIHVAVAGIYIELLIASLAALGWCFIKSDLVSHLLYNLIVTASLSTLLFNINPLMRFDGYYILSDLLEIPNLYTEALRSTRDVLRYVVLGRRGSRTVRTGRVARWILVYGIAASIWRLSVTLSLLLVASAMFRGAGLLLTIATLLFWSVRSSHAWGQEMRQLLHVNRLALGRAAVVATLGVTTTALVLFYLPNPLVSTAPGIVDFRDLVVMRNEVSGFIAQIHVGDGELVQAGDLLLELRNDDVSNEYHDLLHQLEQCRIRHQIAVEGHETTEAQVELSDRQALQQKLAEKQREFESLQVRAPVTGRVIARRLSTMQDAYVEQGTELLSIGNDAEKELVLSVGHDEIEEALAAIDSDLDVRIGSHHRLRGHLKTVEPRASATLAHPALSATVGGPLAVRQSDKKDDKATFELVEPRFRAVLELDPVSARGLACGERGYVRLGWRSRSLASDVIRWSQDWIKQKIASAAG